MERIQELENAVKEVWDVRTKIKEKFCAEHYEELKQEFDKHLKNLLENQKNRSKQ